MKLNKTLKKNQYKVARNDINKIKETYFYSHKKQIDCPSGVSAGHKKPHVVLLCGYFEDPGMFFKSTPIYNLAWLLATGS